MEQVTFPPLRTPIIIIGEASTPAELVALLKKAHFARFAAGEHEVDVDDRFMPAQEAAHDRAPTR